MRKITTAAALAAAATLATTVVPAGAQDLPGAVDVVIEVSGDSGFDRDRADYDMLREALVATGLVETVAGLEDVNIFAPNDRAFMRLARDLGFEGRSERAAFGFLAEATGFESADEPGILADVLLYHVAPGATTQAELSGETDVATALDGATLSFRGNRVVDADPDARNARFIEPGDLETSNGNIHTVNRVLRPVDLAEPLPSALDVVFEVSGDSGFDGSRADYDMLREAVVAAGLAEAIAGSEDVTILAPTDRAFMRLARALGYEGRGEAGAFAAIAEAVGYESAEEPGLLDDVLLYHVLPGAATPEELSETDDVATLLEDATLSFTHARVVDGDPDAPNARFIDPSGIETSNGIINSISQVLRPIDL